MKRGPWNPTVVVIAVIAVIAIVVGGWLLFRDDSSSEPAATSSLCGDVVKPPAGVDTTKTVLMIGDSLMVQPACTAATALAAVGVESHLHGISGTGLLTAKGIPTGSWSKLLPRLLDSVQPDVVVASFVGNYLGTPAIGADGQPIAPDTPAFFAAWQDQARALSDMVRLSGADLYWVQPPPFESGSRSATLFAGYEQLGDHTLPSGTVVAGPDGGYTETNACAGGAPLRFDDGIHYSDAGSQLVGQQLAHDVAAALGLAAIPAPC